MTPFKKIDYIFFCCHTLWIMKRSSTGSTPKQYAYAVKRLNGQGRSKKEIALSVGFAPSVANNAHNKIEKTEGYQNAVIQLAADSNNMALAVLSEYKARGLANFSNKDLNGALNAIGAAWEKFNKVRAPNGYKDDNNPLKKVFMQRVENQTINVQPREVEVSAPMPEIKIQEEGPGLNLDLDF